MGRGLGQDRGILVNAKVVRRAGAVDRPFGRHQLADEFVDWVESSYLLKRAFREVAVISGLVERQHPGKRKTGKQVTFSTDLIYDVLRKYEPDHLLLEAAWADARTRLTDVGRLGEEQGGAFGDYRPRLNEPCHGRLCIRPGCGKLLKYPDSPTHR